MSQPTLGLVESVPQDKGAQPEFPIDDRQADASVKDASAEKGLLGLNRRKSAVIPEITDKDASYGEFIEIDENVHVINSFIDKVGMGRYQWQLWVLCGCGWITDQMLLQMLAVINPRWSVEFGTPTRIIGGVQSCYFAGLAVGAAFWGYGADIWGRRLAFNCTLLTAGVFATILGGMPNYGGLCVMAAFMGVGTGGNLPLDGAIFLEASPKVNQRILMLLSAFWQIGQVIASLVGWGFLRTYSCTGKTAATCPKSENMGWRYTTIVLGLFVLLMWVARFFLFTFFESPKNLLARGMRDRAVTSLNGIAEYNNSPHRISVEEFSEAGSTVGEPKGRAKEVFRENMRAYGWKQVKPLFATKRMAFTTIIVWTIWTVVQIGYTMFNGFLPYYLAQKNVSSGANTLDDTYRQYVYISLSGIPGSFIAMWTVDLKYVGRRGVMAASGAVSAACLALFAELTSPGGQLAANCIQACVGNIFYAVLYGMSPEIFPTYVRGTAVGIASMLARVFAVWVPVVTGRLAAINVNIPLIISAVCFGLLAPLSLMIPIETAGRHAM